MLDAHGLPITASQPIQGWANTSRADGRCGDGQHHLADKGDPLPDDTFGWTDSEAAALGEDGEA